MAAIPYETVRSFLNGKVDHAGRPGRFYSTGDALYTYGVKIAHSDPDGGIIIDLPETYRAPSQTTNNHLPACIGLRERSGRELVKVAPFEYRVQKCTPETRPL